jgi:ectoine hydroxylase-related dioxygenase (phytanoyl-CoA dioxygenase family)
MDQPYPLSEEQIAQYRRDGFIQLDDIVTGKDLRQLREAVVAAVEAEKAPPDPNRTKSPYEQIFIQKVNLWRRHPEVARFVLSHRFGDVAAKLSGRAARVWHDQALFKEPREGAKTPWHQDAVYWPHAQRKDQITIWIALRDATTQNGCMSFVAGTHVAGVQEYINLADPKNLFDAAPQFKGVKPQTCERRAGSCTYHNGLTFHYAGPNKSDSMREAFAIIYMPDGTRYDGRKHIVTDPLDLREGDVLDGEMFPRVGSE